jgi:hypothetical protein
MMADMKPQRGLRMSLTRLFSLTPRILARIAFSVVPAGTILGHHSAAEGHAPYDDNPNKGCVLWGTRS